MPSGGQHSNEHGCRTVQCIPLRVAGVRSGGVYPATEASLVWVDRNGTSEPLPVPPGAYRHMRFSPDGTRLAYAEGPFGDTQIWVYDNRTRGSGPSDGGRGRTMLRLSGVRTARNSPFLRRWGARIDCS